MWSSSGVAVRRQQRSERHASQPVGHGLAPSKPCARCTSAGGVEMITLPRTLMGLIAMMGMLLLMAPAAGAAEPTLSDIAGCNQQAAQKTGASALPAPPGARGRDLAQRAPDGSREPRELPAHGGIPVAGAPGASATPPSASRGGSSEKAD